MGRIDSSHGDLRTMRERIGTTPAGVRAVHRRCVSKPSQSCPASAIVLPDLALLLPTLMRPKSGIALV